MQEMEALPTIFGSISSNGVSRQRKAMRHDDDGFARVFADQPIDGLRHARVNLSGALAARRTEPCRMVAEIVHHFGIRPPVFLIGMPFEQTTVDLAQTVHQHRLYRQMAAHALRRLSCARQRAAVYRIHRHAGKPLAQIVRLPQTGLSQRNIRAALKPPADVVVRRAMADEINRCFHKKFPSSKNRAARRPLCMCFTGTVSTVRTAFFPAGFQLRAPALR